MPPRRRPVAEPEQTQSETGPRVLTLDSLIGGYNGYTSPDLLTPQFWQQTSNVYAGQFGTIRRARWAPFFNNTASGFTARGQRIVSMFSFSDIPNAVNWLIFDNNDDVKFPRWIIQNPLAAFNPGVVLPAAQCSPLDTIYNFYALFGQYLPFPLSLSLLNGPYMRTMMNNAIYEGNGLFRSKVLVGSNVFNVLEPPVLESWGIDSPDTSPGVTLSAGFTRTISTAVRAGNVVTITTTAAHGLVPNEFVGISGVTDTTFNSGQGVAFQITSIPTPSSFTYNQVGAASSSGSGTVTFGITKTVGRSYTYAWVNGATGQVSAPSPASQYVAYNSQTGTVEAVEVGTITGTSTTVTGTGTAFSASWVGKVLWAETASLPGFYGFITSVNTVAQTMTISGNGSGVTVPIASRFQVVDPQVTAIKFYATADGQAVYFLIAQNNLNLNSGATAVGSGFGFVDTANSEPPNPPFASETEQLYNQPPPIGLFVDQYQGRPIVYGVPGAPQTFFYGNIENTVIGVPPESFGPLNNIILPIGDGQINGTANLPTGFVLWSNKQDMFKLTGLLSDNTVGSSAQLGATIQRLPYKIGCASPYATAVTNLGAFWLSTDREVWLFTDHYAPKNVGKPVQDVLASINGARLKFAKMDYYKTIGRSWLRLAVATGTSTFNNKLLLLDLDLLASNGQPSYFTFDMATNAPTWYQFDINCEGICTSYDNNSILHAFVGDVDLITDIDWMTGYQTIASESYVPGSNTQHAFGNEDPHMIKTFEWMRAMTNQLPNNFANQNWQWNVFSFDDDKYVMGVNSLVTKCVPGVNSSANPLFLEYSPGKFKFGGFNPVKGRRFQIQTVFPSLPGLYELRGFQVSYTNLVGR